MRDKKYGVLVSGQKRFLNLVAEAFDCKNRAKSKGNSSGFSSSESYYLRLGTDLFDAKFNSFELSMKRKRPIDWKIGSNIRRYSN